MIYALFFLFIPLLLTAFEPRPITPYPVVGYREIPFYDDLQKVERIAMIWHPVNPDVIGAPSKDSWDVFNVAINAPVASSKTKMPVIVISHGYTGNPHQLSWLIRGLTHNGFIALAIQHRDLVNGKAHANHWQRAIDVSNILTQFSSNPISQSADLNKIGIAGYSLGGTTAIWIEGGKSTKLDSLIPGPEFASPEDFTRANEALPTLNKEMMSKDWREPRVKAAFIMAPAWSWLFDEESLRKISIPTYLIASSSDKVLVSKNNAGFFARNIPHAIYQEIPGKGNHYIFISALNEEQSRKVNPSGKLNFLFEEDASIDRSWIQLQVVEEAVGFFKSIF